MAFDRGQAERNLENILGRIREVSRTIERDILDYRSRDTLVSEEDESRTLRDIRAYALRAYRELDSILTELDRYK